MRRIIFTAVVLLLFSCSGEKKEMFTWKGVRYPVVRDAGALAAMVKSGKRAALRFRLGEYKQTLRQLAEEGQKQGCRIREKINTSLLVCSACRRALTAKEIFEMLLSGSNGKKQCPSCSAEEFMLFSGTGK